MTIKSILTIAIITTNAGLIAIITPKSYELNHLE